MGQDEEPRTSRARILHAAEDLLRRKSAQFVHVRDVAQAAGVSPALILRYYRSKDELVFTAIIHIMAGSEAKLCEALERLDPPTASQVFSACMATDVGLASHLMRDLLSMSFWWSREEETYARQALGRRSDTLARLIAHDLAPLAAAEAHHRHVLRCVLNAYLGVLRWALVTRASPDKATAAMLESYATILAGARAQVSGACPDAITAPR